MYLNPGKTAYEMATNSEIYIDKTEMIMYLNTLVNTNQRFVSVSRPRRFGKSMAADMICAYYDRGSDSYDMFCDKKISLCPPVTMRNNTLNWDSYINSFNVLYMVMTDFADGSKNISDMLEYLTEEITSELIKKYPEIEYGNRISLRTVMNRIYEESNCQFVVIIDEWDVVFRLWKNDKQGQTIYLDFLRDLMKGKNYIALAYMTGILPIKKYGQHSALNMFEEYSMIQPMRLAEFTGFTESEVKALCKEYEMEFDNVSKWYNGYRLTDYIPVGRRHEFRLGNYSEHKLSIYSPLSVVNSMRNGIVDNYWNKTETYEALADYIKLNFDGLKDTIVLLMNGARIPVSLKTYQNDMTSFTCKDDILALLIHLGYLGFEGDEKDGMIDSERGTVFIPNLEIMDEFKTSTETSEWEQPFEQFKQSLKLLDATWNKDEKLVAELLETAHNKTDNKTYNSEAALSYGIQLAYYAAQKFYTTVLELDSGKGYADIVYLPAPQYPDKPVLLIELKYGGDETGAISQIRKQNYPDRLEHYKGHILLVGINYNVELKNTDPAYKHHTCKIEEA